MKLKYKFLLPVLSCILLLLLLAGTWTLFENQKSAEAGFTVVKNALESESQQSGSLLSDALESDARNVASLMAKFAPDFVLTDDIPILEAFEKEAEKNPKIVYALFLDADGNSILGRQLPTADSKIIIFRADIVFDEDKLGQVLVGIDSSELIESLAASRGRLEQTVQTIFDVNQSAQQGLVVSNVILALLISIISAFIVGVVFKRVVEKPLGLILHRLSELSDGKLIDRLQDDSHDEFGTLSKSVNQLTERLHATISVISVAQTSLSEKTLEMNAVSSQLAQNMEQQKASIDEAAGTIQYISSDLDETATRTAQAALTAEDAHTEATSGTQVVTKALQAIDTLAEHVHATSKEMNQLQSDSQEISTTLSIIGNIAKKTNLLALNASVEAARAGENGRGFAVVADEIRTLSHHTKQATETVEGVIGRLLSTADSTLAAMEEGSRKAQISVEQGGIAGQSLATIGEKANEIKDTVANISRSTEEQSVGAKGISESITNIIEISKLTSVQARNVAMHAGDVEDVSQHLADLIGKFDL